MAPCYRQNPYSKTMNRAVAKTNIERFDEMSADILAHLYNSFPIPVGVSPEVSGLTVIKYLSFNPVSEEGKTEGEHDPETEFFDASLNWLVHSGFVWSNPRPFGGTTYSLTAYGLQALKHVPRPELGNETLGEKLSSATKSGAGEIAKETLNQALSIGMQALWKGIGG